MHSLSNRQTANEMHGVKLGKTKVRIYKIALRLTKELQIKERSEAAPVNVAIKVSANR